MASLSNNPGLPHYLSNNINKGGQILKWDGSYIGSFNNIINNKWVNNNNKYISLNLYDKILYCKYYCTEDLFQCIVEDIKGIFNIIKIGFHRIRINNKHYFIYKIPVENNVLIDEISINRLLKNDSIKKDSKFKEKVLEILVFSELLALKNTSEKKINVRVHNISGEIEYLLVCVNTTHTIATDGLDNTVITKNVYANWFGESMTLSDGIKKLINNRTNKPRLPFNINDDLTEKNLTSVLIELRNILENIILLYDKQYLWYINFILDRITKHLIF